MKYNQDSGKINFTKYCDDYKDGTSPNVDQYLSQIEIDTDVARTKINARIAQLENALIALNEVERGAENGK